MVSELKPCPFCGAVLGEFADGDALHQPTGCILDHLHILPEMREAWNTRTADPALVASHAALLEVLRDITPFADNWTESGCGAIAKAAAAIAQAEELRL